MNEPVKIILYALMVIIVMGLIIVLPFAMPRSNWETVHLGDMGKFICRDERGWWGKNHVRQCAHWGDDDLND